MKHLTNIEEKALTEEYIKLGNLIIDYVLNNDCENVGIFATYPDEYDGACISWIKSMFHGCEIGKSFFEAALDSKGKTFSNMKDYDMCILINPIFNSGKYTVQGELISSDDIGVDGSIPIIKIDYFFTKSHFVNEIDCVYVSNGVTEAGKKRGIFKD